MSRRRPRVNGGRGGSTTEETDGTDDGEEPDDSTSMDVFSTAADPEFFDATYQATADNWQLSGTVPSPVPFPLQALPRLAFVINYNYAFDEDRERWEPQKKGSLAGASLVKTFEGTITGGTQENSDPIGDVDRGDSLLPVIAIKDTPTNVANVETSQGRVPQETDHVVYFIIYDTNGDIRMGVEAGVDVGSIAFELRLFRVGSF